MHTPPEPDFDWRDKVWSRAFCYRRTNFDVPDSSRIADFLFQQYRLPWEHAWRRARITANYPIFGDLAHDWKMELLELRDAARIFLEIVTPPCA